MRKHDSVTDYMGLACDKTDNDYVGHDNNQVQGKFVHFSCNARAAVCNIFCSAGSLFFITGKLVLLSKPQTLSNIL